LRGGEEPGELGRVDLDVLVLAGLGAPATEEAASDHRPIPIMMST
jgi:hypothetical protein